MKAKPLKIELDNEGYKDYVECSADEATHLTIKFPSPAGLITLPVMTKGIRAGTGCWTWNGDTNKPTIRPSILTTNHSGLRCHSWVNDGQAQFLSDCSHALVNKTVEMLEVN